MSEKESAIALAQLREHLHYEKSTGKFFWIKQIGTKIAPGTPAGSIYDGYVRIRFKRKGYRAHRIAWAFIHGEWPGDQIDHINRVRDDNRITNLRVVTHSENQLNTTRERRYPSNKGIRYSKEPRHSKKPWEVYIREGKTNWRVGRYGTKEAAIFARNRAMTFLGVFSYEQKKPT